MILSAFLAVNLMMPAEVFASQKYDEEIVVDEATPGDPVYEETDVFAAFDQEITIEGVTIRVTAPEGIFPSDAMLDVKVVTSEEAEEAVASERDDNTVVASSYTYDIKVLDVNGNELQPEDSVNISFSISEVEDKNLNPQIYHITENGEAEALEVTTTDEIVSAETDGFSLYVVEFTYNSLSYLLSGDKAMLSDVLKVVGLEGTVESVSGTDGLEIKEKSGDYEISIKSTLSNEEKISVTIDNIAYEIAVTGRDAEDIYDISKGNITISATSTGTTVKQGDKDEEPVIGSVVITGETDKYSINISAEKNATADVVFNNLSINLGNEEISPISVHKEGDVVIELDGITTLKAGASHAGIEKSEAGNLIINDKNNLQGILDVTGGRTSAGIGGGFKQEGKNITINGGNITITGGDAAAGIGGGFRQEGKNITINGGNITIFGGDAAAGIGGGATGVGENITINGGNITVTGGEASAGIGGGAGEAGENITINGGDVTVTGGVGAAGIGGGANGAGKNITISGGKVHVTGREGAAGIGGGVNEECENITISGGNITVTGDKKGSGIGSGSSGHCENITISGGELTVTGGEEGAGIGAGSHGNCGNITISGGDLTVTGGEYGVGIGVGSYGIIERLTISGGIVNVTGGKKGAGIGGLDCRNPVEIIISGGQLIVNADSEGDGIYVVKGFVSLGWTNKDDFIQVSNFKTRLTRFSIGRSFYYIDEKGASVEASIDDIAGRKIMPYKSDAGVKITEGGSLAKTYGDAPFSLSASAEDEGTFGDWGATGWTWTSSDTDVAEVDNTGKVTIKNASRTPVTLTATYESDTTLGSAEIELAVNKREITFTSGSAEREYNGNPLTNDEVIVGGDGFVAGEGATYEVTGSQTIVGNSDNMFTYVFNDNTNADNYKVSTILGTLKVVSRTDKYKISPQANSKTVDYDGFAWEVTGFETDTYEVDGNTYTVSGLEAYANEKEVGEHPVNVTGTAVVKDSKGNDVTSEFEVTPKPGKLIIKNSMIQYTVTFKVENGEWNDGGSDDKTVTLSRKENEDLLLTLKAEDIPGVGNKPSSGFKAGEWDITPSTEMVISRDRVFTYTYDQKAPVSHTVTFKVENGTWNDGTTEDKKIILSGYEGDTLKLSADQIPLVGTKPDSEHKKGKWDVTPNIATEITGDTTYTYTYADKKMIKYTVTFKVENGTWSDGTTDDIKVTLTGYEGDTLKLPSDKIPTVGDKPATNYKEGSWDVVPSTDAEISKATTYTYKYAKKNIVSHTVTFKVVDGSWNDGTALDKVVTLNGYEGDTLTLAEEDIPSAGEKPADTYKAGGWDTVPTADTELTADVTYTYSYAKKDTVTYTATFKVENGTWNDGTTDDITLTISGYEGDALKFTSDDIPSAGEKPAETYKAGQWDTAFSAENVLTGDTTYTYTYKEKDKISKTVIFKVKNGTWNDRTSEDRIVTLNGYEGDILKLSADQIPSAGDKPGDGYTEGKWDAVPDTDKEVTADAVYTYTYDEKIEVVKPEYYFVKGADGTVTEGAETEQEIIVKRTIDDEHCKDHHRDVEFGGVILEKDTEVQSLRSRDLL